MSSRPLVAIPRHALISPGDPEYNKVIRLEGQINSVKQMIRFLWRYNGSYKEPVATLLPMAREIYFQYIDDLLEFFLFQGIDLAYGAKDAVALRNLVDRYVFPQLPLEDGEVGRHWAWALWHQELQQILEDDTTSICEALEKGFLWFICPEQYPAVYDNGIELARRWTELDNKQQEKYLRCFYLDATMIDEIMDRMETSDYDHEMKNYGNEASGLVQEFRSTGLVLDVQHPALKRPDTAQLAECPRQRCKKQLLRGDIDSDAPHRPVQTACGHIIGYSCLQDWFAFSFKCPICLQDLGGTTHEVSSKELVRSCDRALKWLQAPVQFYNPEKPHDHLSKLLLIFEPANEIRKHLKFWPTIIDVKFDEWIGLQDLGMYLARDRLDAAVKKDLARYKRTVHLQVQVGARRIWLEFIDTIVPRVPSRTRRRRASSSYSV